MYTFNIVVYYTIVYLVVLLIRLLIDSIGPGRDVVAKVGMYMIKFIRKGIIHYYYY